MLTGYAHVAGLRNPRDRDPSCYLSPSRRAHVASVQTQFVRLLNMTPKRTRLVQLFLTISTLREIRNILSQNICYKK